MLVWISLQPCTVWAAGVGGPFHINCRKSRSCSEFARGIDTGLGIRRVGVSSGVSWFGIWCAVVLFSSRSLLILLDRASRLQSVRLNSTDLESVALTS